jgi:endonuclease/exonuclease/phosphatase family metal-dependent hydrolase
LAVRWNVRTVDWIAGLSMVAVVAVGGSIILGAPVVPEVANPPAADRTDSPESSSPTATPIAKPRPTPRTRPRAQSSPRPVPSPKPGPKPKVTVHKVPESGTGMQIVLPGTALTGPAEPTTVDVTISSFNVLGASHTTAHGEKPAYAEGATRAGWAAQLIRAHDVDIVGLQELQDSQMRRLIHDLPGYDIFPGPSMTWREAENSIMWRSDEWYPVQASTIAIPYFFGQIRHMPYVRLRNRETGTDIWVANFHNPANVHGNAARWRAEATRREAALATMLRSRTHLPVVFTGDYNDRSVAYCAIAGTTELRASIGGSVSGGVCRPPVHPGIDWVFGTPEFQWLSTFLDRGALERRTSDHPMVVTKARLNVVDQSAVDEATQGLARVQDSLGGSGD